MGRRKSRQIMVGNVAIGGEAPISVQSMLNTKTTDVEKCIEQITALKVAGCDLIRIGVPDKESAIAFGQIVSRTGLPLIADIHYNYDLAVMALANGAAKIRMNPGNMRDFTKISDLVGELKNNHAPIRIGVNSGSIHIEYKNQPEVDALVNSAMDCVRVFEKLKFYDIVIGIKSTDINAMLEANRRIAKTCDYPLHIGVTEAGTLRSGLIRSTYGIGTMLEEGIGDTIRLSISSNPVEEVFAARTLLKTLGLKKHVVEVYSCPTCARAEIDVSSLANEVEKRLMNLKEDLKIAVMGCPLNGIGEGENADLGIAGGKTKSVIMAKGKIIETVNNDKLLETFEAYIDRFLSERRQNENKTETNDNTAE